MTTQPEQVLENNLVTQLQPMFINIYKLIYRFSNC